MDFNFVPRLWVPVSNFFRRFRASMRDPRSRERALITVFALGTALALVWFAFFSAPQGLATPTTTRIKQNESLPEVASDLKTGGFIRSAQVFEFLVRLMGADRSLKSGSYYFGTAQNVVAVVWRLRTGDFEITPVRVGLTEDMTAREIGTELAQLLKPFDENQFLALAVPKEGYLYPDTYFFYPDDDPAEVEQAMEQNFADHLTAQASSTIAHSGHSFSDVLIMASILVGEARSDYDRRVVAGILWKRIALGMPLQVDAPFGYVLNKALTTLTSTDLKINSPYNTYTNKGLPPTPIGNPSINAILDAAMPIKTSYLYYLSDNSGVMHYSATFATHEAQISEYLK